MSSLSLACWIHDAAPAIACLCVSFASTLQVKEHEQEAAKLDAVFPCILKILPTCVFNKKDPIVVGADVVEGIAKVCSGHPAVVLTLCNAAKAVAGCS